LLYTFEQRGQPEAAIAAIIASTNASLAAKSMQRQLKHIFKFYCFFDCPPTLIFLQLNF
jgi:hypothetical protein